MVLSLFVVRFSAILVLDHLPWIARSNVCGAPVNVLTCEAKTTLKATLLHEIFQMLDAHNLGVLNDVQFTSFLKAVSPLKVL